MSREKLIRIFEENSLSSLLTDGKADKLCALCTLLQDANTRVNLTAVTDEDGIYVKHFADSALLVPMIPQGARVLDVGCGGGFPSLVLAVLREDISVIGMDSTGKKLDFVRYAIDALGLNNLSVISARAEDKAVFPYRESFDIVCARAVALLPVLCELCMPYVKVGGAFVAMKTDGTELKNAKNAVYLLGGGNCSVTEYLLKGGTEEYSRALIKTEKLRVTPDKYPRSYSLIKSKPL